MVDDVEARLQSCLRMTEALLEAMDVAARSSDPSDVWRFASFRQFMRKTNEIVEMTNAIEPIQAPIDTYNMDAVPTATNSIAMVQQDLFETTRANLRILRAYLLNRVHPKSERVNEVADFLNANLRRAVIDRPEQEKDIQNVIEQIFIGRGMEKGVDYDREVGRVKVSSKEVIPDFILPALETAVEVKFVKDARGVGRVVDEINADIRSYGQKYLSTIFVVYDLNGSIRDHEEFRRDLEAAEGVKVLVVKH